MIKGINIILFFLISIFGIFNSCIVKKKEESFVRRKLTIKDFPDINYEKDINKLIHFLDSANCVYRKGVGWGYRYSDIYANYERLSEIATKRELFDLTKHKNPTIRIYAYGALLRKHSSFAVKTKENLINDTANVCYFRGCIRDEKQVKELVETLKTFPL